MVIFFSIVVGISLLGSISEADRNKSGSQNMAAICVAGILAIIVLKIWN